MWVNGKFVSLSPPSRSLSFSGPLPLRAPSREGCLAYIECGWMGQIGSGGSAYGQPPSVDCGQRHSGGQPSPYFQFMRLCSPVWDGVCTTTYPTYVQVPDYSVVGANQLVARRAPWEIQVIHAGDTPDVEAQRRCESRCYYCTCCCRDPSRVMHGRREERVVYLPAVGCM